MKKRLLAFLLALCYICTQTRIVAMAEEVSGETNDEITGRLGDNGGFVWNYDPDTATLSVTGVDTWETRNKEVSILEYVEKTVENVIFKDCIFSGSLAYFIGTNNKYNEILTSVEFDNCDVSNVTDMQGMFFGCWNLSSIDIKGFDTSKVTDMSGMFFGCWNLSSIDIKGFDTSKVTDMSGMFSACGSLTNLDLTGFDTSNVQNMADMFGRCAVTSLDLSGFDTSKVTDMSFMFSDCNALVELNLSSFNTSNVTNMSCMFYFCSGLANLDLSGFNTTNVQNMSSMFFWCSSITNLDLSGFDTSNVTNMSSMFCRCYQLEILDVSGFDTSNVTDMSSMFFECNALKELNLSSFNTSNVTNMSEMFGWCYELINLDVSGFDTSKVTDMSGLFERASKLQNLDVSSFNTEKVTNMSKMFWACNDLQNIDVSSFDTRNVTDMSEMFAGCMCIDVLDLSKFNTSKVEDMKYMFRACYDLKLLNLSGLDLTNLNQNEVENIWICDCSDLLTIYTPKKMKGNLRLPVEFYDANFNSVREITSEYCNTILTRNKNAGSSEGGNSSAVTIDTLTTFWIRVLDVYSIGIPDVTITYGDNTCTTNEYGNVEIDREKLYSSDKLVVSKEGYCTWTLDISELSESTWGQYVLLYRIGEEELGLKYVSEIGEHYETTDLLSNVKTYNIQQKNNVIKIFTSALDTNEVAEYQLWQKDKQIATSNNGVFEIIVNDKFTVGGNCFIRVVGKNGITRDTKINLSFISVEVGEDKEINLMDEELKVPVSDDVPFFGGSEIEISMPLLPIDVVLAKDKVYVGINMDLDKGGSETEVKEKVDKFKKNINSIRRANEIDIGKKHVEDLKEFIKETDTAKLPGGDYEIDVVGYVEGNAGEMIARGGIYILLKAETPRIGFTTMVGYIPVTVHFQASAEGIAIAEVKYDMVNGEFDFDLSFDFKIGIEVFGGVGVKNAAAVGAYGAASLEIGLNLFGERTGVREVALNGELGIEAYLADFKYQKAFAKKRYVIYNNPLLEKIEIPGLSSHSLFSASNYEEEMLNYLANESDWYGYPVMLNYGEVTTDFMSLLENTYRNAQPVMVSDDDTLYAAFLGADENTGEIYVQCTKMENGVWYEPVRIDSGAILDGTPQLLADAEGNIWLAYTKTRDSYESNNLLSYAKNQSIVVGMLDKDTLELTNVREYSSNDYMHMQQISLVDGNPTVAWVESVVADEDSVLASYNNKIVSVSYSDGQWSDATVVKVLDSYLSDMAIGDIGFAYSVDIDDDLTTLEDTTFVYCDWLGNEKKTVEGVTGNITYGKMPGETQSTFIWNGTDKLCSMENSIDVAGITNEYVINNDSIYYGKSEEGGSELAVVRRNSDGTYTGAIQLTDSERYIENISVATVLGKDVVLGMHTSVDITEETINTSKNLVWSLVQPVNDIRIDDVYYDDSNADIGEAFEVELTVTNAGENPINNVNICLNGEVVSTQEVQLKSGESKDVTFEITYPETLTSYTITVEDADRELTLDYNQDDNTVTFDLGHINLEVEAVLNQIGNNKTILAMVTNNGIDVPLSKVTVLDQEGNMLALSMISNLENGKTAYVELPIDADISDKVLNVVVESQQEELYTYDNVATVYVPLEDSSYKLTYELDGGVQNIDNPTHYYDSDDEIVLLTPTKEGHIFEGWYSDAEFTTKVESIAADSTGDITLYAKWFEIVLKNGFQKGDDGQWYYFVDDVVDTSFTGLAKNDYGWWYVKDGELDRTYTGLGKNEYGWWYVKDGKVDMTFTGMAKNENGWFYVKSGKVDLEYTGLAENQYGTWYMVDGKVASNISGLTKVSKVWLYLTKGKVDTSFTGLAKNEYGWWYVTEGQLDKTYTGMAKNENGWFYVKSGKVDLDYTGLAENEYGTWYMVDGKVASNVSGLTKVSKVWMYLVKGKVDTDYVGLAKNESGWWYVENGTVDFTYTGMAKNQYGWWYVTNGKLDRSFTGIASNEYGRWYIKNGAVEKTYTGTVKYNGVTYNIKNGKVVK